MTWMKWTSQTKQTAQTTQLCEQCRWSGPRLVEGRGWQRQSRRETTWGM